MACRSVADRWRQSWRSTLVTWSSLVFVVAAAIAIAVGLIVADPARPVLLVLGVLLVVFGVVYPEASELTLTPKSLSLRQAGSDGSAVIVELNQTYGAKLARVARTLSAGRLEDDLVNEALGELLVYVSQVDEDHRYDHALCEVLLAARRDAGAIELDGDPAADRDPASSLAALDFDHRAALVLHEVAEIDGVRCAAVMHLTPELFERRLVEAHAQRVKGAAR